MTRLRVNCFSVSLDGYGAGPQQSPENPLGKGGEALHDWFVPTRAFRAIHGAEDGTTGPDNEFAARQTRNIGAWIMGRNMFGPVRGPWPDASWTGWWGDDPPFRCPVFVLTHYERSPVAMPGGTVFHFVTEGIEAALDLAVRAAGEKDVLIGGGVATIRQYLGAGLVDEMHLAVSPVLLGSGEHLLSGIDTVGLGYRCSEHVTTQNAMHAVLIREE
ncbi:deaminase [Acuticoccus sediminis]|uniref:Deaminase n=1 Tax=Acuticoccus sediminis TaxID=2184697 RepID=A0A8B2NXY7_9HYPH|nr:dihydrofolate reductase family protein [Acuticoccus sediminis]RAI02232.1 deaminase [Acuticoccus sediminis]